MTKGTSIPSSSIWLFAESVHEKYMFMRAKRLWDGIWHSAAWMRNFWLSCSSVVPGVTSLPKIPDKCTKAHSFVYWLARSKISENIANLTKSSSAIWTKVVLPLHFFFKFHQRLVPARRRIFPGTVHCYCRCGRCRAADSWTRNRRRPWPQIGLSALNFLPVTFEPDDGERKTAANERLVRSKGMRDIIRRNEITPNKPMRQRVQLKGLMETSTSLDHRIYLPPMACYLPRSTFGVR